MKKLKKNSKIVIISILGVIGLAILFEFDYLYVPLAPPENLTDIEITLERTACFGTCPIYSVSIDGEGNVVYEGKKFVRIEGVRTYTIPQEDVKELVAMFYGINYFSLNDRYDVPVTDNPTIITSLKTGDKKKTVSNYANSGPTRLHELEIKIDEITNSESYWKD